MSTDNTNIPLTANTGAAPNASVSPTHTITWRGSPNFWQGRANNQPVLAIVDHIMQSSIESADAWFQNTQAQVSAHYGVALDGRIYQWVKETDSAWANGNLTNPDLSVGAIKYCQDNGVNPNSATISIEHEGYTGNPMPEAQYQASLWLHKQIIKRHTPTLVADRQHILGHYQFDSVTRINCPGKAYPFERLIQDLTVKNPILIDPNPNPDGFNVGAGVRAVMHTLGDSPTTNEQYATWQSDGAAISLTWGVKYFYLYDKRTDKVTHYAKV